MNENSKIIVNKIEGIRKWTIIIHLLSGFALIVALLMAMSVIGVSINRAITGSPAAWLAYMIAPAIGAGFIIYKFMFSSARPFFNKDAISIKVEQKMPGFQNALISSYQFIKNRDNAKPELFSKSIISLLIDDTAAKVKALSSFCVVDKKSLNRNIAVLTGICIVFIGSVAFNPAHFLKGLRALASTSIFSTTAIVSHIAKQGADPALGDITLEYTYPFYTGIEPATIVNAGGNIEAVKGSEVTLTAVCNRQLKAANFIFKSGSEAPLKILPGNIVKGELRLFESDEYKIEMIGVDKGEPVFTNPRSIKVLQDLYPKISATIDVKEEEQISEKDYIKLEYKCADDYGLNAINLHYNINSDKPGTITFRNFKNSPKTFKKRQNWDLNTLRLRPGDKLSFYLETTDTDTVSGPKSSSTETFNIEIYNYRKKHEEIVDQQEDLLHEMRQLLTKEHAGRDALVKAFNDQNDKQQKRSQLLAPREAVYNDAVFAVSLMDKILRGMETDVMANYSSYYILGNIRDIFDQLLSKNITSIRAESARPPGVFDFEHFFSVISGSYGSEIAFLQNNIPMLERLLQKEKLDDMMDDMERFTDYKDNIDRLLNELEANPDKETREKALEELREIEKMIKDVMQKLLSHLAENRDLFGDIQLQLAESIENEDLQSALETAKQMLGSIENALQNLLGSQAQSGNESFSEFLDKINEMLDRVTELETGEQELAEKTDELKNSIFERTNKSMDDLFKNFFEKQKERVKEIQEKIDNAGKIASRPDLQTERKAAQNPNAPPLPIYPFAFVEQETPNIENKVSYLNEMLSGWDIKESWRLSNESLAMTERLRVRIINQIRRNAFQGKTTAIDLQNNLNRAIDLNRHISKDLNEFLNSMNQQSASNLTEEENSLANQYTGTQEELEKIAESIQKALDQLMKENPMLGKNAQQHMNSAAGKMTEAKNKLMRSNVPGALIDERESLHSLGQVKNSMEQSKKMMKNSFGSSGMKIPFPLSGFRGGFRKRGEGMYGLSTEDVEVPGEEEFKAPKEFREAVLEGMKGAFPQKYESMNKAYFRTLLR